MIHVLVILTTLTLTCPIENADGIMIPAGWAMGAKVYNRNGDMVADSTCLPGERIQIDLGGNYCGRFTVTAYWLTNGLESIFSPPVTKACGCFGLCHSDL